MPRGSAAGRGGGRVSGTGTDLQGPVICVVGPTASGKSELAQRLGEALGGEVVSADSMQVYRGMDIGTGKVPAADRRIPHHGLDLVDPGEPYSAALFQDYGRRTIAAIDARGSRPLLCGGTGFYVRAVIDDYDFPAGEQQGNPVRDRYNALAAEEGPEALWERLRMQDPASAELIAPRDVKRVVRAFELLEEGTTYARQKQNLAHLGQALPAVFLGIAVQPDELRRRIDRRVDAMVETGLIGEVQGLLDRGFREGITAPQAIGYKEMVAYLDGTASLDGAIAAIKTATHRYAKRQRTWFRKDGRIHWIDGDGLEMDVMAQEALELLATIGCA